MSALGRKQTIAVQKGMSALPPKADICSALAHVCFGPMADMVVLFRVWVVDVTLVGWSSHRDNASFAT
jgi:hypothetical protein